MSRSTGFNRRQFLRTAVRALGGAAAGCAWEGISPGPALAQPASVSGLRLSDLLLLGTHTEGGIGDLCPHQRLLMQWHGYQYDCRLEAGQPLVLPADLVRTFRLDFCAGLTELIPIVETAPATETPGESGLPPLPTGVQSLHEIRCRRWIERRDEHSVRVYEACSFYCGEGLIRILVGGLRGQLLYAVDATSAPPPSGAVPINVEEFHPGVHFGLSVPAGRGGESAYYVADNQEHGFSEQTIWTADLPISRREQLRVAAFIPGARGPQQRTKHAVYEIAHAEGTVVAAISQQQPVSGYVTLGVFDFVAGPATVRLTNETGEPAGTTEVIASGIRWTNA